MDKSSFFFFCRAKDREFDVKSSEGKKVKDENDLFIPVFICGDTATYKTKKTIFFFFRASSNRLKSKKWECLSVLVQD